MLSLVNSNVYSSLYQTVNSWVNNVPSMFGTVVSSGDAYRGENAMFRFSLSGMSGRQTYVVINFNDLFGPLSTPPAGAILLGPRSLRFNIINQTTS